MHDAAHHRPHVLVLGGAGDARALINAMAIQAMPVRVTLSLAGRTRDPGAQYDMDIDVAVRTGGYGGAGGLAAFIRKQAVVAMINATHPFAAQMANNAAEAARLTGIPLLRLQRSAWLPVTGDHWIDVADMREAVAAIGAAPRRVFLAIGRQQLAPFMAAQQHHYLVRTIDPPDPAISLSNAIYVAARGPFSLNDELGQLREHQIELLVAKNSGGAATYAKIEAARALGLPVVMVGRPAAPAVTETADVAVALRFVATACRLKQAHDGAPAERGE